MKIYRVGFKRVSTNYGFVVIRAASEEEAEKAVLRSICEDPDAYWERFNRIGIGAIYPCDVVEQEDDPDYEATDGWMVSLRRSE